MPSSHTSDKVAFTLGFVDEVSKVHPVGFRPRHPDLADSLLFVQKTNKTTHVYRLMALTTKKPNKYRLSEAEFRQFASTAVSSAKITEKILYVIHGGKARE
jgi:hypothetical protein